MKKAIIYSSLTGNTKMIAQAIHAALPPDTEIYALENAPDPAAYDFLALGYWVEKGMANQKMLKYIEGVKGKKIALFATLAAWPDSDHAKNAISRTASLMPDCELVGHFVCQGKLNPALRSAMSKHPDKHHPMTPERQKRLAEAEKHPNEQDCATAREVFGEIARNLS